MSVITFLLNYLQLYILVIQSIVQDFGVVLIGQSETMFEEEGCDLTRAQPVTEA